MRNLVVIAMLLAAACGGKKKNTTTPEPDPGENANVGTSSSNSSMIPGDKIDEIQRLLERRRETVSRCLTFAINNKDLPKSARGRVTLAITVTPSGKADAVKVLKSSIDSKSLNDCVVGKVKETVFPEIPKSYETTYTYTFEAS
jgi:TonB family protein